MPAPTPATHAPPPQERALGVAVIGHAFMGRAHSSAWRNVASAFDVPAVTQRVLVGTDAARTAESAARLGWAESATDWRAVLERDDVDIVDICAPGYLHAEMSIAALNAGKHVLVEKPLANSVAEAEAMVTAATAARQRGVQSLVGFNYRRVPALALAKQMIAAGRLGQIRHVRVSYVQDWLSDARAPMSWRLRRETAGSGALGDLASHAVDQVHFLLGEYVTELTGATRTFEPSRPGPSGPEPVTVDDAAWATMFLGSGAVASLEVSRVATGRKNALRLEVFGSSGSLVFDLENPNELHFHDALAPVIEQGFRRILVTEPDHPYLEGWWPQGHVLGWEHSFTHEVRDFLLAIGAGTPPTPSFEDGLAVQRVLAAIERSAAAGSSLVAVTHGTAGPMTNTE